MKGRNFLKISVRKSPLVLLLLIFVMCQSAPRPRERWNPYYYPTVRSLSSVSALSTKRPITKINYFKPVALRRLPSKSYNIPPTTNKTKTNFIRPKSVPVVRSKNGNRRAAQLPSYSYSSVINNPSSSTLTPNTTQKFLGIDIENFDVGNATAIGLALNEFLRSGEHVIREVLQFSQNELLRMIGQVDVGADRLQKRFQDSTLHLALAGQKAAAVTYKSLPTLVNKLVQRITMPMDSPSGKSLNAQVNDAIKNLRQLKKMLYEALDEHEKDFHNVFSDRFAQINQYLGVQELPRRPLAWFS